MKTRRSAHKLPEEAAAVFVRAEALRPAQWRSLDLSPRTGWVVGVVAPPRPAVGARVECDGGAASGAIALEVLLKVDSTAEGNASGTESLSAGGGTWAWFDSFDFSSWWK